MNKLFHDILIFWTGSVVRTEAGGYLSILGRELQHRCYDVIGEATSSHVVTGNVTTASVTASLWAHACQPH